jgi:hypothetical protein
MMKNLLEKDHDNLGEMLENLSNAFENANVEEIYTKLDFFWARLAMHIRAEHLHLFPAISCASEMPEYPAENDFSLNPKTVRDILKQLRDDHDFFMHELAAAIKMLREIREENNTDSAEKLSRAREKVAAVSVRLEAHNELEESEVYLWAEKLLVPSHRDQITERMKTEIEHLPPRFDNL